MSLSITVLQILLGTFMHVSTMEVLAVALVVRPRA